MSRHEILIAGFLVIVGWDPALGFFAEVQRLGEPHVIYDTTTTADGVTTIAGVLHMLIEANVITRSDVADAERWLAVGDVDDVTMEKVGVRIAAEVITHLREAAA